MSPPSATSTEAIAAQLPSAIFQPSNEKAGAMHASNFPTPLKFDDPYKQREYLKGRLILAYRIFAKLGFDEGVAGHITLRVGPQHESFSFHRSH